MGKYLATVRTLVEEKRTAKQLAFDEAVAQVRETLCMMQPDALTDLDTVVAEHHEQVKQALKLSEQSTSFTRDEMARGWYTPRKVVGGVWDGLSTRMSDGNLAGAVASIDASSGAIVAHLAEPMVADDKRRGLVIGNVQSGKTANYAAVIAKALDEGYKLIIVLAGIHSNLRQQTQRRLERDLGTQVDSAKWHRLTSADGDIGKADIKNAAAIISTSRRTLAVVKKNTRRLENLRDFLKAVDPGTIKNTPILIIDDESDQATPDASAAGASEPTGINQRMREIWSLVNNGTYVGYTATPFANVFMDPASDSELYPADFLSVMPTPDSYFGAERLFGLADAATDVPDVIRYIGDDELPHLAPPRGKGTPFSPEVTESLATAIRWFIIAAAVRRTRGQGSKHSTMLIHTTHRVEPHFQIRDAVDQFIGPLAQSALDGDVSEFYDVFHEEMNRAAELYTGDGPAPTWPTVKMEIPNVLRTLKIAVDNSSAEAGERLDYLGESPQTVIVIGGGTLSRGLTLEGLFVSFFTRTSNAYDTLLQMGRWFGYRAGYEDLQRVWVSPGLDSDYRFLASVEADLRIEIDRMTAAGQIPRQIGLRIKRHPGRLEITSKNKMKHTERVEVDFEGYRLQTTVFDVSDAEELSASASDVSAFLTSIMGQLHHDQSAHSSGPRLFQDVSSELVLSFLGDFRVHDRYSKLIEDAAVWTRSKLPDTPWNVVLASGSSQEQFSVGGLSVRTVNRSPLAERGGKPRSTDVDIRALMSAGDLVADLRILDLVRPPESGQVTNRMQMALRSSREGAAGRGLLVLYPISRNSPVADSKTRQPMSKVLGDINPELIAPGAPPIFGIALVTPFDVDGVVQNKGEYVAVRPPHSGGDDEFVEETPVDDELDYSGGDR
ncbi:Z1 domain-containing protein [Nocardia zapadnayensis]|nr:Z1 domain-containing protein [Nocardia zapadnayensis]MCX0278266.1 Z1 domain-containing protein [Nocardia zapadnayensis]